MRLRLDPCNFLFRMHDEAKVRAFIVSRSGLWSMPLGHRDLKWAGSMMPTEGTVAVSQRYTHNRNISAIESL